MSSGEGDGRRLQRRLDVRAETSAFAARPAFIRAFQFCCAFKSCCNAAEVSDMSETAQAEGGIVVNDERFDFETCEEIGILNLHVRFPSVHDVACRRAMHPAPAVRILASRR